MHSNQVNSGFLKFLYIILRARDLLKETCIKFAFFGLGENDLASDMAERPSYEGEG